MILSHQKFDFRQQCLIEKITIKAPFRFETVFQNEGCFIYFLEGTTRIYSAIDQEGIAANESVLLRCGAYLADLFAISPDGKYEIIVFHLYPDILRGIYADQIPSFVKPSDSKSLIRKITPSEIVKKFIEGLLFYFDNQELVNDELLTLKIKELILLLIQTKSADSILSLFSEIFTPRNVNIKEVVSNHLFSNLSVEDMARLSNLSVSTFNRTFQTIFHDTPANYIKSKRLERARELLSMSSLSVSEIAFQTGFHDVAHFSRSFKEMFKTTPTAFRDSIKNN